MAGLRRKGPDRSPGVGENADKALQNRPLPCPLDAVTERPFGPLQRRKPLLYAHAFANHVRLFLGSSAVEHSTVNRMVAGSNPARGAKNSKSVPDTWVTFHSEDIDNTFG